MEPNPALCSALSKYTASSINQRSNFDWDVRSAVWLKLGIGFDHEKFQNDRHRQNVELKHHFARYWATASFEEKLRLAGWIVSDWGGIRRNSEMTLLGYVNQVNSHRPATPFSGVASYSKILAMKDPLQYAVFDSRVAASLNALQTMLIRDGELVPRHALAFLVPAGKSKHVAEFDAIASHEVLEGLGYTCIKKDDTYGVYLSLLHSISKTIDRSILDVEMYLFSRSKFFCGEALPLLRARTST